MSTKSAYDSDICRESVLVSSHHPHDWNGGMVAGSYPWLIIAKISNARDCQ